MSKEPLYPHVPGGGKLPPTVTGPASLKKFGMTSDFRNKISLQVNDEAKAVQEYKVLADRARNMGQDEIAKKLADISNQEAEHKRILIEIQEMLWAQERKIDKLG